jgi:hypothetical protein
MKCQAGGDDVYILTKITRDDELKTKLWLKQNLSKYVGHIKELNSFIVEDSCDADVVEGIRFCRKRIRVREERHHYLIESEPAVPLNEVLTMLTVPRKQATQDKMMRTVGLNSELLRGRTRSITGLPTHFWSSHSKGYHLLQ